MLWSLPFWPFAAGKTVGSYGWQVLARSSPTDKFTLVKLLKETGEVVAVTGDGECSPVPSSANQVNNLSEDESSEWWLCEATKESIFTVVQSPDQKLNITLSAL